MGDLREQLLKAKLIDETKSREVKREKRRKRKQKGVKALEQEAKAREESFRNQRNAQAITDKQNALRKQQQETAQTQSVRLRQLISSQLVSGKINGPVKFYFVSRTGFIPSLEVSSEIADSLRSGKIAIVEQPGLNREIFSVVPRETALKIQAEAPEFVRFFKQ